MKYAAAFKNQACTTRLVATRLNQPAESVYRMLVRYERRGWVRRLGESARGSGCAMIWQWLRNPRGLEL